MADFQKEKQIVREFYKVLDQNPESGPEKALAEFCSPDLIWRAYYPFDNLKGHFEIISEFWKPLKQALTSMRRRQDIFFAGKNMIDDYQSTWVVSMGHLMGLFDKSWLGIPPTNKIALLRYCEFHRVENGQIQETALYFDIPHLMVQAGLNPFPEQTAVNLVQPGPATHDGLLLDAQPQNEGDLTLKLVNKMIGELGQWQSGMPLEDELRLSWNEDMTWWGPTGIGATYTIERYAKQHSGPFRDAFSDRSSTSHIARLAEGNYGGFFGWPNFSARLTGDFMGYPSTDKIADFRVMDLYRRDGDKLSENWIFIDIPFFLKQNDIDIFDSFTA